MSAIIILFFITLLLFNPEIEASPSKKARIDLPKSQQSEMIQMEDELFVWMDKLFRQHKDDYRNALAEIEDVVANSEPVKRDLYWVIEKTTESYQLIVGFVKPGLIPFHASKTYYYIDPSSGEKRNYLAYRVLYKDGNVISFRKSKDEGLVFYNGTLDGYYFKLNENRTYEIQLDEKGKFLRAIIRKPRKPKPENPLEYDVYFPEQTDLDILKNKLLHRLVVDSLIVHGEYSMKEKSLKNKSLKNNDYELDCDEHGKVKRFYKKITGKQIVYHTNGKVKSFVFPLLENNKFEESWDSDGNIQNSRLGDSNDKKGNLKNVKFKIVDEITGEPIKKLEMNICKFVYFKLVAQGPSPYLDKNRDFFITSVTTDSDGIFALDMSSFSHDDIVVQPMELYDYVRFSRSSSFKHDYSSEHVRIVLFEPGETKVASNKIYDLKNKTVYIIPSSGKEQEHAYAEILLPVKKRQ